MSAPVLPPVGPGSMSGLIKFLQALPTPAQVTDWQARREDDGRVRLTLVILFPGDYSWSERS